MRDISLAKKNNDIQLERKELETNVLETNKLETNELETNVLQRKEQEKVLIREMLGITQEESGNYFIRLKERNRIIEWESNIIHNPEIICTCLKKAMNGLDINYLHLCDLKRLVLGMFYYNT